MLAPLLKPAKLFSARVAEWLIRRRAIAELYSLDDASLADLGITREDIPQVMCNPGTSRWRSHP
jgi:uncharacterized protein YjiS (DUF1127 family)